MAFFVLAATLGAAAWPRKRALALAIGYAVCPVWSGLILTDLLASSGRQLFPLTLVTLTLSLVGHLIDGSILALGYLASRSQEGAWPLRIKRPKKVTQLRARRRCAGSGR